MFPLALSVLLIAMTSVATAAPAPAAGSAGLPLIPRPGQAGTAASVRVPDGPMIWTEVITAPDQHRGTAQEAERALQAAWEAVATAGGDGARTARVNAYVANDQAVKAVEAAIARRFASSPVAVTVVRTPLEKQGATVGFELVAEATAPKATPLTGSGRTSLLPAGGKLFISGQAERGTDVATAVRLTMAGLHRSLAHVGLAKSDVVQVKAFIQPFADHAAARREIAASFDGGMVPPVVLIEWVSELYAEIELVASARTLPPPAGDTISHDWLPWLTKSPRYCHVTQLAPGTPMIFLGAIDGGDANDPRTQMKVIFERLGSSLFEAGSSYRHMAKATYYLSHPTARALLGDIRGVYFDPTRPPSASALNMKGVGYPGRAAMVDMIAVPVK